MEELGWKNLSNQSQVLQVPLHFNFQPVQILSKQLTKLNSNYPYRICYLGVRWSNSSLFHKMYSQKHGYDFDLNKVNKNNTFFSQSMSNNRYYRNQIYYRAFQGSNPTIRTQQLVFDSKFESGNLDCVVKVGLNQYDLFLRIDSNTRGHIFWFYFTVSNGKAGETVRFNICNLMRKKSLYSKKFKPYVLIQSQQKNPKHNNWSQQLLQNVKFEQKKLRYDFIYDKIKVKDLYQLSFQYTFSGSQTLIKFAYCIPYTYSQLLKEIKQLENVQVCSLGHSLTGLDIPLLIIGQDAPQKRKPVVFITGRVHPGQSNGSIMLSGFMKYICNAPETQLLRKIAIIIILPMINPDGVVLGNSRTGASGKDLNRQFRTNNKSLYPQVCLIKKFIRKILCTHEIYLYLDFHGHSRRKNMFMYGPQYNITQSQYYKSRVLPKLLSSITTIFRYFSCNFTLPECKRNTARAVMINQFKIPIVYTVQTSVGFYHDFQNHKDNPFLRKNWQILGQNIGQAIKQYVQGVDQYESFLELRRKAKRQQQHKLNAQQPQITQSLIKNKTNPKQLKLFRIFQQIKQIQQKQQNKKQVQLDSDDQSDSHNEQQDLQKNQMAEFQSMVTDCCQTISYNTIIKEVLEPIIKPKKLNQKNKNKQQEMQLINEIISSPSNPIRTTFKTHITTPINGKRQHKNSLSKQEHKIMSNSQGKKNRYTFKDHKLGQREFINHDTIIPQQQKPQKILINNNITIYNFSKMIQDPKSPKYQLQKVNEQFFTLDKEKNKHRHNISVDVNNGAHNNEFSHAYQFNHQTKLINKVKLFESVNLIGQDLNMDKLELNNSKTKSRTPFPPSFYRIKYQSATKTKNKKKINEQFKDKSVSGRDYEQKNLQKNTKTRHIFLNIKRVGQ